MSDGEITLVGGEDGLLPLNQEEQIQLDFLEADYGHLFIQDGEHLGYIDIDGCGCEDQGTIDLTILGAVYRGESLYQMAVRLGFTGTEEEFLLSLVGPESPNAEEARAQADRAEAEADRAWAEANRAETAANLSFTYSDEAGNAAGAAALSVAAITAQAEAVSSYVLTAESHSNAAAASAAAAASHVTAAETAAANAEVTRLQTVSVYEDAQIAQAAAESASTTAVTMRNQAEGFSQASAAHRDTAQGYVTDAASSAQAASEDRILASAYREDANASAEAAALSETQAASYASDSLVSATASQTSRLAAEVAFDGVSGTAAAAVESAAQAEAWADAAGEYAAATSADRVLAQTASASAAVSASNSATAEENAEASASAAASHELNAEAAKDGAETAAAAAVLSSESADASSSAAAASATAAQDSSLSAATSATNADTSATSAAGSATAADGSATAADASADAAALSEAAALTYASNASVSESAAATSASDAAGSASTASTQATLAASSATTAGTHATNAGNSATNADASADAADASAGTAAIHASAASVSATAAATSASDAAGSASTATTQANLSATSATNAGNSATSAGNSATAAGNSATAAGNSATAALASQGAASVSETNAATSASNAAGSASTASTQATLSASSATTAGTHATNAGNSATAADLSADAALASQSAASVSATNAATSATNAAGSASTATTQAALASTSATNAGISATAAATSASSAGTSATNAGNSATASNSSAVSAQSSAAAALTQAMTLFPDRLDATASYFTDLTSGAPATSPMNAFTVTTRVVDLAGYGSVFHLAASGTGASFWTRGTAPAAVGRVYELEVEYEITVYGAPVTFRQYVQGLSSTFAAMGTLGSPNTGATAVGIYTMKSRFSDVASTGVTAWVAGAVNLRFGTNLAGGTGTTVYVRRMTVKDVTATVAAELKAIEVANLSASLFPETFDATGSNFSFTGTGAVGTQASLGSSVISNEAGYGFVAAIPAASYFYAKGAAPATSGKIYEVEVEWNVTVAAATANLIIGVQGLTSTYTNAGQTLVTQMTASTVGIFVAKRRFGITAPSSTGSAWPAGSIWLRPMARTTGGAGNTQVVRRMSLRDVTAVVAAENQYTNALLQVATILPERLDDTASQFTTALTGTPISATAVPAADIVNDATYGYVYQKTALSAGLLTRGTVPATAGKVYEVIIEWEITANPDSNAVAGRVVLQNLSATHTSAGGSQIVTGSTQTAVGVYTNSARFSNVASTGITAWNGAAIYLRFGSNFSGFGTATTRTRRITVRDVTALVAAEGQAALATTRVSALFPETFDSTGTYFTDTAQGWGDPATVRVTETDNIVAIAGLGYGWQYDLGNSDIIYSKGALLATAGKVYEVEAEIEIVTYAGTSVVPQMAMGNMTSTYANNSNATVVARTALTAAGIHKLTFRWSDVAPVGGGAWRAGSVYIRPGFYYTSGTGSVVQLRRLRVTDVTTLVAAEVQATAAATSASAASTSATAAGTSATASQTSATNAATSAGNAATSATAASTSATNASGSANSASTSASAAATSATAASGSATAAATSATNAATSATDASNSATSATNSANTASTHSGSANTSAINAASSASSASTSATNAATSATTATTQATAATTQATNAANSVTSARTVLSAVFPERIDSTASDFTSAVTGAPFTGAALNSANVVTQAGYGFVYNLPANADFATKGAASAASTRIYEIEIELSCPTYAANANPVVRVYGLNSTYGSLGSTQVAFSPVNAVGVFTYRARFGLTAETGPTAEQNVTAWFAGSVWLRPMLYFSGGAGTTVYVRRFTVKEVSAAVVAERSATAAFLRAVSLFPDRLNSTGSDFTTTTAGDERAGAALSSGNIVNEAGYGFVYQLSVGSDLNSRGFAPAVAGRVYEIEAEFSVPVYGTSGVVGRVGITALNSAYANLGQVYANVTNQTGVGSASGRWRFSDTAPTGGSAWTAGAVWLRATAQYSSGIGATVYLRRLTMKDVTALAAAETSATNAATSATGAATSASAASTSASTAGTQAGVANTHASAANTSATAASGSATAAAGSASASATSATAADASADAADASATAAAGSASSAANSATNAATSATNAAGSASSAATSATSAAGSATNAGNSATAASTSASGAATSATNAGNSASAAASSETNAANSATNASNSASAAATSASGAATSATNSGNSATAANTSAVNAASSYTAANTSATNAAGSATAAAGSATAASNSATAAATSASGAATSATAAGNSATAANSSAVNAASSYAAAQAALTQIIPDRPSRAADFYTAYTTTYATTDLPPDLAIGTVVDVAGEGSVRQHNASATIIATKGWMPVGVGQSFSVEIRCAMLTEAVATGDVLTGFAAYTAAGVYLGQVAYAIQDTTWTTAEGWRTFTVTTTSTAVTTAYGTAAYIRALFGVANTSTSTWQVSTIKLKNITSEVAAASSASAAATSASTATTQAGAASTSASAANTSAVTASTQATNAGTSATNAGTSATNAATSATAASTSAASASTSATAASNSAVLAASVGLDSINKNPVFVLYPTTPGLPTDWINGTNGTNGTRVTGQNSSYAYSLAGGAGAAASMKQRVENQSHGWYVLEADVTLGSGALTAAGLILIGYTSNTYATPTDTATLAFSVDKDVTDSVIGSGTVGRTYRFRKLVQIPTATTTCLELTVASHSSTLGSQAAANTIVFHRANFRPASQAEIAAARADTNATTALANISAESATRAAADTATATSITTLNTNVAGNTASISTQATAISNINGRVASTYAITVGAGNRFASMKLLTESGGGTEISTFDVQADKFRIYNDTTSNPVFEVSGGVIYIGGDMVRTGSIETGAAVKITAHQSVGTSVTIPSRGSPSGHVLIKTMDFDIQSSTSKLTVVVSFAYSSVNSNQSYMWLKIGQTAPTWATSGSAVMTNADATWSCTAYSGPSTLVYTFTGLPVGTNTLEVHAGSTGSGSHSNTASDCYFSVTEDKKAA